MDQILRRLWETSWSAAHQTSSEEIFSTYAERRPVVVSQQLKSLFGSLRCVVAEEHTHELTLPAEEPLWLGPMASHPFGLETVAVAQTVEV